MKGRFSATMVCAPSSVQSAGTKFFGGEKSCFFDDIRHVLMPRKGIRELLWKRNVLFICHLGEIKRQTTIRQFVF